MSDTTLNTNSKRTRDLESPDGRMAKRSRFQYDHGNDMRIKYRSPSTATPTRRCYEPPVANKEETSVKKERAYTHYIIYSFPPWTDSEGAKGDDGEAPDDGEDDDVIEVIDGEEHVYQFDPNRKFNAADSAIEILDDENDAAHLEDQRPIAHEHSSLKNRGFVDHVSEDDGDSDVVDHYSSKSDATPADEAVSITNDDNDEGVKFAGDRPVVDHSSSGRRNTPSDDEAIVILDDDDEAVAAVDGKSLDRHQPPKSCVLTSPVIEISDDEDN